MNKTETKHRRKLNDEQLEVLELLHKFRFGSNDLIAQYFGKKDRSFVFKRMKILSEQGLIGKRFDSSYRIQGKPAAYYLTPAGARVLQERREPDDGVISIQAIYKNKAVSEQFIRHCLDIFTLFNQLKTTYGSKLKFFTKADLGPYDYFPQPLPDAYMRLETGKNKSQFFMEIYHDNQPFFTAIRRIKQLIDYRGEGEWAVTETDFPKTLFVCESSSTQKRLNKRIARALNDTYENDIAFYTTTQNDLKSILTNDVVWREATEPDEILSLTNI